jgi:hypothetical protein
VVRKMRGRADGVVMRYETQGAWDLVTCWTHGLLRRYGRQAGYGEWSTRMTLSAEGKDDWAAFGPRTSGNEGTLPVTSGQHIAWS